MFFARRIGLLHLAPTLGDLDGNAALLARATEVAAEAGAEWVVSGELVCCGYDFEPTIGVEWIACQPDGWLLGYADLARRLGICAFVHRPHRDVESESLLSAMYAVERACIVGCHYKLAPIPGVESWASRGPASVEPVDVDGHCAGMLVCADAYRPRAAGLLVGRGAEVLVSSAAWHPGEWGPAGEWEARSAETGVPVIVCNRTGWDGEIDFRASTSVVAFGGRRLLSLEAPASTVFVVDVRVGDGGCEATLVRRVSVSLDSALSRVPVDGLLGANAATRRLGCSRSRRRRRFKRAC